MNSVQEVVFLFFCFFSLAGQFYLPHRPPLNLPPGRPVPSLTHPDRPRKAPAPVSEVCYIKGAKSVGGAGSQMDQLRVISSLLHIPRVHYDSKEKGQFYLTDELVLLLFTVLCSGNPNFRSVQSMKIIIVFTKLKEC